MKPVNRKLADEFHGNSSDGVDAVFERMFEVAGNSLGESFAEAFDVSENTIKTWRRRDAVSTKFLQGFANKYGRSLDYLMHGATGKEEDDLPLSAAERTLVEHYRAAPKELREAALRVLQGGGAKPPTVKLRVGGAFTGQMVEGSQVNRGSVNISNTGRKKK